MAGATERRMAAREDVRQLKLEDFRIDLNGIPGALRLLCR
jgi:hypothetical protein